MAGLSPLARGTHSVVTREVIAPRFIPAGAGNTSRDGCTPYDVRFIPAGAGNTIVAWWFFISQTVYPRWRGEHFADANLLLLYAGLSPLARGTRVPAEQIVHGFRFIPAGAGNTGNAHQFIRQQAVYPRWRGEHQPVAEVQLVEDGLSPLARGTRNNHFDQHKCIRFIPAGAGNTKFEAELLKYNAVYPRWRGEHPGDHVPPQCGARFIPAGAGNTDPLVKFQNASAVYPRWRGEHFLLGLRESVINGLSPLARGTPATISSSLLMMRFIPAGAGNT
ncbi:Domain of uncharacterised function (DUF2825) [Serratia entomophila]|nr:Domain of uncharacterised function (DUF2825) [Serratia entomophila]